MLGDDAVQGLGTAAFSFLKKHLFGVITHIAAPPVRQEAVPAIPAVIPPERLNTPEKAEVTQPQDTSEQLQKWSELTQYVPDPGYFLAGGLSGVTSRTTTAPLDRLKVYLIAQTGNAEGAVQAAKDGAPLKATQQGVEGLSKACRSLWAAGGIRSLFAGTYNVMDHPSDHSC